MKWSDRLKSTTVNITVEKSKKTSDDNCQKGVLAPFGTSNYAHSLKFSPRSDLFNKGGETTNSVLTTESKTYPNSALPKGDESPKAFDTNNPTLQQRKAMTAAGFHRGQCGCRKIGYIGLACNRCGDKVPDWAVEEVA